MKTAPFLSYEACNGFSVRCARAPRSRASALVVFIHTNGDGATVGGERVRWNLEVVGRGLVGVDASGEIEVGTVARAKIPACPVGRQAWLCAGGKYRR